MHRSTRRDTLFIMQRAILAVSPNLQFLEQIRSHLEEGGRYRVKGVTQGGDALALVKNSNFDIAILDAEASDIPFVPFTQDLVATQPGLKLLVFPPQNNPHHPALTGLVANGFLKKPFFTPEVSRALTEMFKQPVPEVVPEPESPGELAELWMNRPEMGISRIEQLLGSTTAQTGLLIARGRVIAASGAAEDAAIRQTLNLLDRFPVDARSLDLLRFITASENSGEILMYASQLIAGITLVLFYPSSTSILLARQEVFQVKQEFKEAYPTTAQLRQELEPGGKTQPVPAQSAQPASLTGMQEPMDSAILSEAGLVPLENEIEPADLDSVLNEVDLRSLDAMLAEMPSPDPVLDESTSVESPAPLEDIDLGKWLAQEEVQTAAGAATGAPVSEFTPDDLAPSAEAEDLDSVASEPYPPLPADYLNEFAPSNWQTIDAVEEIREEQNPVDEIVVHAEEELEAVEETSQPVTESTDESINFPWESETAETESPAETPLEGGMDSTLPGIEVAPASVDDANLPQQDDALPSVNEEVDQTEEDSFNAWLKEFKESQIAPAADQIISPPYSGEVLPPLPAEWQTPAEGTDAIAPEAEPVGFVESLTPVEAPSDLPAEPVPYTIESVSDTPGTALPESPLPVEPEPVPYTIESVSGTPGTALPESPLPVEPEPVPYIIESVSDTPGTALPESPLPVEPEPVPYTIESVSGTPGTTLPESPLPVEPEPEQPPALPAEHFSSHSAAEPGTAPLGIRNFRFQYTCLLIPRDPKQFLTRDLNERLSFLLPQLHLEYGWHLTGIAIRPQHILWSIAVPIETSPIKVIQEIRRRTSAHLFSNFPDLNPGNDQADFWAPGFLALSGSTRPSVGMIYDFTAQIRKNQKSGD